jgi:O-succinylbenzoic acid--CoA ligase
MPLKMKGATLFNRFGLILEGSDENGNKHYSEVCPFPNLHAESLEEAINFFEINKADFTNVDINNLEEILEFDKKLLAKHSTVPPSLLFAVSMLLIEVFQSVNKINILNQEALDEVSVNALISASENVYDQTKGLIDKGYKTIKLKVGSEDLESDIEKIKSIEKMIVDNDIKIRLDVNRNWSYEQVVTFADAVKDIPIEYIEEPISDITELRRLYEETGLNIALDETLYEDHSYDYIASLDFVKAYVIKLTVLGGLSKLLKLKEIADSSNIDLVFSSAFESGIGMKQIISLASALSQPETAHGFDTYKWLKQELLFEKPEIEKPIINTMNDSQILSKSLLDFSTSFSIENQGNLISNEDLKSEIEQLSATLNGVLEDDIRYLAIAVNDKFDFIKLFFAIINTGRIAVLINTRQSPESIENLLLQKEILVLITDIEDFFSNKVVNKVCLLVDKLTIISISDLYSFPGNGKKELELFDFAPSTIMFTSGTTAEPKAVLHTLNAHVQSALSSTKDQDDHTCGMNSDSVVHLSLPLYHVGGLSLVFRSILAGAKMIAKDFSDLSDEELASITHISIVNTQLADLIESGKISKLENIKMLFLGGGKISEKLIRQALEHFDSVYLSYGSTELASTIYRKKVTKNGKSGQLMDHCQLMIDEDNEILVKGDSLMLGYWSQEGLNEEFDSEGWYHSGDLGEFDENGILRLFGRKDNMLISGGENISPEFVESRIRSIEGIVDAIVVAIDDERYGKRPVAFIEFDEEYSELKRGDLEQLMPKFMIPDHFFHMPENIRSQKNRREILEQEAVKILAQLS